MRTDKLILLIFIAVIFLIGSNPSWAEEYQIAESECQPKIPAFVFSSKYPLSPSETALDIGEPEINTIYYSEELENISFSSYHEEFINNLKNHLKASEIIREFTSSTHGGIFIRINLNMISVEKENLYIEATMAMRLDQKIETKSYAVSYKSDFSSTEDISEAKHAVSQQLLERATRDIINFLCGDRKEQ